MKRFLLWIVALLPALVSGTELAPWFGESFQLDLRGSVYLQQFTFIATKQPNRYSSFDQFYTASLSTNVMDIVNGEAELTLANTRHRSFGFDNVRFTGRTLVWDDITGDLLSLTVGATVTAANRCAVDDLGSFHHGTLALESHLAFGRETPCAQFWFLRWWGVLGYGIANEGKPWFRGDLYWARNFWDTREIRLFVHSLWGLGDHSIKLDKKFHGYGPIKHRSVDLGIRFCSQIDCVDSTLSFEYVRRLHALNFPKYANVFMFRIFYPLGI